MRKDLAKLPRLLLNLLYVHSANKPSLCDSPASASHIAGITDLSPNTHHSQGSDSWSRPANLRANGKMNWESNANIVISKRKGDSQAGLPVSSKISPGGSHPLQKAVSEVSRSR